MPAKYSPYPMSNSTARAHSSHGLLLLGLMYASVKYSGVPNIDLSGERILKIKLRKYRGKYVMMRIFKLFGF